MPPRKRRLIDILTSDARHEFRYNNRRAWVCVNCRTKKQIAPSGAGWFFVSVTGAVSATETRCHARVPQQGEELLNLLRGAPRGGLTADQIVRLAAHLPEAAVRRDLRTLDIMRLVTMLDPAGDAPRHEIAPKGFAYLNAVEYRRTKRPPGRPRKYAEGEPRPKRAYRPTGNPMGRPRKYPLGAAPPRPSRATGKPRGRPRTRALLGDAKRPPARRIADMTPDERLAYYERQRERAAALARSWRKWARAARLAARHVASMSSPSDDIDPEALAWLRGAR